VVVDAIKNDDYDRGECDYTLTQLLKAPRQEALRAKHADKIEVDAADLISAFEGKILHKVLENANRTGIVETRYFATIAGKVISGQIDSLAWDDEEPGVLSDWKRGSVWKARSPDPDWTFQMNGQHYLLKKNGIEARGLQIILFAKDHSKVQAVTTKNYMESPIKKIPIEMWSDSKVEDAIAARIEVHEAAKKKLPLCSDDERWRKFNRSFGRIVSMNCLLYCSVKEFCTQYQEEKKNEI
jgi:hypothetical protein